MTPAAWGNQDTTAAVFNGLDRICMVATPPTWAQRGLERPQTGMAIWGKLDSSLWACQILDGHFHKKKWPAASWISATELVKPCVTIFAEKKAPAANWIAAAAGLVESWVVIFIKKSSACGMLVSSNTARACQNPDYGCTMDVANLKVTLRTGHTPLHTIAV